MEQTYYVKKKTFDVTMHKSSIKMISFDDITKDKTKKYGPN